MPMPMAIGPLGGPLFALLVDLVLAPFKLAMLLLKVIVAICALVVGAIGSWLGI